MGNTFVNMIDLPEQLADAGRNFVETGGENILFGPQARNFFQDPLVAPQMSGIPLQHNMATNTELPKQAATGDPLSTSSQYQSRFGASENHF